MCGAGPQWVFQAPGGQLLHAGLLQMVFSCHWMSPDHGFAAAGSRLASACSHPTVLATITMSEIVVESLKFGKCLRNEACDCSTAVQTCMNCCHRPHELCVLLLFSLKGYSILGHRQGHMVFAKENFYFSAWLGALVCTICTNKGNLPLFSKIFSKTLAGALLMPESW